MPLLDPPPPPPRVVAVYTPEPEPLPVTPAVEPAAPVRPPARPAAARAEAGAGHDGAEPVEAGARPAPATVADADADAWLGIANGRGDSRFAGPRRARSLARQRRLAQWRRPRAIRHSARRFIQQAEDALKSPQHRLCGQARRQGRDDGRRPRPLSDPGRVLALRQPEAGIERPARQVHVSRQAAHDVSGRYENCTGVARAERCVYVAEKLSLSENMSEWFVLGRKARHIADDLKEKRNMLCLKCLTTNIYKRILGVAREDDFQSPGYLPAPNE